MESSPTRRPSAGRSSTPQDRTGRLSEAARLADQLERSFRGGAWHGPALTEAVAKVDAATAARHPVAGAHSIWEIVGHLSTWLDVARRRIEGEAQLDVPAETDWPSAPPGGHATEESWRRELATLEARHRRLQRTVRALDDDRLGDAVAGSDPTVRGLLQGILQHAAYHGGQIVLLRRAAGSAP